MPAPDFTIEITILVNANMTPAGGYSAQDNLDVIAFLVADIVPLVNPSELIQDYTDPINEAIKNEAVHNFGNALEPFKNMLEFLCYETINTIVLPYYSGGGVGAKLLFSRFSQAGVLAPTFDFVPDPNE